MIHVIDVTDTAETEYLHARYQLTQWATRLGDRTDDHFVRVLGFRPEHVKRWRDEVRRDGEGRRGH